MNQSTIKNLKLLYINSKMKRKIQNGNSISTQDKWSIFDVQKAPKKTNSDY